MMKIVAWFKGIFRRGNTPVSSTANVRGIQVKRPGGVGIPCGKKIGIKKFCTSSSICDNCAYIQSLEQDGVKLIQAIQKIIGERDVIEKERDALKERFDSTRIITQDKTILTL